MKFTYLGTAASEGFPAVFCNCDYCRQARKLGGKNIRTRSQAIINYDLLIDFPADTYFHFLNNDIEGDKIKYLLVTHSHPDHFYIKDLELRGNIYFSHDMRIEKLKILCGEGTARALKDAQELDENAVEYELIKPFETVKLGDYTVTALPARHFAGDGALFYIIKADKTILYAHDTGYFYDEVFEYIQRCGIKFDMISLDCTNIDVPVSDEGTHMGIDNVNRVVERLYNIGAISKQTIKYINHFSHNGEPIHHKLEERVFQYGYKVSFDGESIEI